MNKGELVDAMAERAGLDKRQVEASLHAFVDAVMDATKRGDRVAILGFGTFNPTSRAARVGRNPQTGAPVKIAASKGVRFAAGSAFKTTLNGKSSAKKSPPAKKAAPAKKATTTAARSTTAKKSTAKKTTAKKATKSTKKK